MRRDPHLTSDAVHVDHPDDQLPYHVHRFALTVAGKRSSGRDQATIVALPAAGQSRSRIAGHIKVGKATIHALVKAARTAAQAPDTHNASEGRQDDQERRCGPRKAPTTLSRRTARAACLLSEGPGYAAVIFVAASAADPASSPAGYQ